MCYNLPSICGISDIPMVVYNLNPSIRSTLLTVTNLQFIFLMNSLMTLIQWNVINIIPLYVILRVILQQGTWILVIMGGFVISKGPKYEEPKQICFEEACEEIQTGIYWSIHWENIKLQRHLQEPFFRMEKSCYVISKWKNLYH